MRVFKKLKAALKDRYLIERELYLTPPLFADITAESDDSMLTQ